MTSFRQHVPFPCKQIRTPTEIRRSKTCPEPRAVWRFEPPRHTDRSLWPLHGLRSGLASPGGDTQSPAEGAAPGDAAVVRIGSVWCVEREVFWRGNLEKN